MLVYGLQQQIMKPTNIYIYIYKFLGYFGNFLLFQEVFLSFLGFKRYLCHFIDLGGYFGLFLLVQGYFDQFLSFRGILINFQVSRVFQSFFKFQGYFGNFKWFFLSIFGLSLDLESILEILKDFRSTLVIFKFQGHFSNLIIG